MNCQEVSEWFFVRDGKLFWKKQPKFRPPLVGKEAGTLNGAGYLQVTCQRKIYLNHRIIWMLCNGLTLKDTDVIDHVNGSTTDNYSVNLHRTTTRGNAQNHISHRNGKIPGVCKPVKNGKYRVCVAYNNNRYHIGYFATADEARAAYLNAVKEIEK